MASTGYLNEDVAWGDLPDYVHQAFTRGNAVKVLLPAGFQLCKLSDFESLTRPGSGEVSPWWSPLQAYDYDPGWEQRKRLAAHFGVSIREMSRILVAVKENWNAMNFLLKSQTRVPIHAFFGGVAGQARLDPGSQSRRLPGEGSSGSKGLVGSASQFYIPGLTIYHVAPLGTEPLSTL